MKRSNGGRPKGSRDTVQVLGQTYTTEDRKPFTRMVYPSEYTELVNFYKKLCAERTYIYSPKSNRRYREHP